MARNPNPNARKNIKPGLMVPQGLGPELEKFLQNVKEMLQGADGTKGQPKERFVTLRDLEEIGLITTGVKNGRGVITQLNAETGTTDDDDSGGATELADLTDVNADDSGDGYVLRFSEAQNRWNTVSTLDEPWEFTRVVVDDVDFTNAASLTADLDVFTDALQGVTPASGGGAINFLRADGTWAEPAGGTGSLVYANTSVPAGNTVANTVAETAFSSQYDILANRTEAGSVIRIRAAGVFSSAAVAPDLRIRVKLEGQTVLDTGAVTLATGLSDDGWLLDATAVVFTAGATGTIDAQGTAEVGGTAVPLENTATFTVDTTADMLLTVTAEWSAADVANTITLRELLVYLEQTESPVELPSTASFLTVNDESATLASSRRVLAGNHIEFDDTVANTRTVNVLHTYIKGAHWEVAGGDPIVAADAPVVYVPIPLGGAITEVTVLTSGGSGDCEIDIWKDTYANFPPTVVDSILSAPIAISAATKYSDTALANFTSAAVAAGDVLAFKLDDSATFTVIDIILTIVEAS